MAGDYGGVLDLGTQPADVRLALEEEDEGAVTGTARISTGGGRSGST